MWEDAKKAMLCASPVPGRASSYPGLDRGPSRRLSCCGGWGHVVLKTWWPFWIRLMPEMSLRVCKRATGPFQGCIVCGPYLYIYSPSFRSSSVVLPLRLLSLLGLCQPGWSRVFGGSFLVPLDNVYWWSVYWQFGFPPLIGYLPFCSRPVL